MKRLVTVILLLAPCFLLRAQPFPCDYLNVAAILPDVPQERIPPQRPTQDEIESRRIAYLSTAISLSPSEAAHFWPVYNEWNKKLEANMKTRHAALKQIRQLSKEASTDEKAYMQQNKILIDGAAGEAHIMADAHQAYIAILGAVRTAKLYLAEEQFRNILIRELREHPGGNAGKPK